MINWRCEVCYRLNFVMRMNAMAKKQSNNSEEQLYYQIDGIDLKFRKNWMPICSRCVNTTERWCVLIRSSVATTYKLKCIAVGLCHMKARGKELLNKVSTLDGSLREFVSYIVRSDEGLSIRTSLYASYSRYPYNYIHGEQRYLLIFGKESEDHQL